MSLTLDAHLDRAAPEELALTRREHTARHAVLVDHTDLALAELDDLEVLLDVARASFTRKSARGKLELRHRQVVRPARQRASGSNNR